MRARCPRYEQCGRDARAPAFASAVVLRFGCHGRDRELGESRAAPIEELVKNLAHRQGIAGAGVSAIGRFIQNGRDPFHDRSPTSVFPCLKSTTGTVGSWFAFAVGESWMQIGECPQSLAKLPALPYSDFFPAAFPPHSTTFPRISGPTREPFAPFCRYNRYGHHFPQRAEPAANLRAGDCGLIERKEECEE